MKIFLADLVHTWSTSGIWTFPLNVGYVASYTQKKLADISIISEFMLFNFSTTKVTYLIRINKHFHIFETC